MISVSPPILFLAIVAALFLISVMTSKLVDYCYDRLSLRDDSSEISESTKELIRNRIALTAFSIRNKLEDDPARKDATNVWVEKYASKWGKRAKDSNVELAKSVGSLAEKDAQPVNKKGFREQGYKVLKTVRSGNVEPKSSWRTGGDEVRQEQPRDETRLSQADQGGSVEASVHPSADQAKDFAQPVEAKSSEDMLPEWKLVQDIGRKLMVRNTDVGFQTQAKETYKIMRHKSILRVLSAMEKNRARLSARAEDRVQRKRSSPVVADVDFPSEREELGIMQTVEEETSESSGHSSNGNGR